ncbi:glycoside hydrolase family 2 protein [Oleiagrimonas sp. C23AA]|uniref:beta-mannosidase n=1 Tax=Oleiagrimonas sp. C23AA TaxID=2719047 RepID=UPI0014200E4B|nr:glycoside hydrolase family 2 protein [Oleiagrimonas sp. C23AA]NII10771.1 glycoside hydrolase family 2 protein [Oleiagrimonas sp. C23AA]
MKPKHLCALRRLVPAAFVLPLLAAAFPGQAAPPTVQTLDSGWQFRLAPGDSHAKAHPKAAHWHAAQVPGTAQTDLMAAHLTPDPYYRDNEKTIQWVGLSNWDYRTSFDVSAAMLARQHVALVFKGLDTFADVIVNGHKVITADNMFRHWRAQVKRYLHAGHNTLEVHLYSPIERLQPWLEKQPYALPGEFDSAFGDEPKGKQTANYIRKAKYGYGWDWGPRIVTIGIWKKVQLEGFDALRVSDFHIAQTKIEKRAAHLDAQLRVHADTSTPVTMHLTVIDPEGHTVGHYSRQATVDPGNNTIDLPLRIAQPQLWYPNGYGRPSMYRFKVSLSDADGRLYDGNKATGLRHIELRRAKDKWGRSFEFVINGIPVFAKGADVIPFDSFPPRATRAQMHHILASAKRAHMNMLRIWGGGYYLPDSFYQMADRMGLMVWQDFMFGGAIPPYNRAYRQNTRIEAMQQVRRLRDHPSIVLWCGNNEVQTGWESWPDRAKFAASISPTERDRIVTGMVNLFGNTLRTVVTKLEPQVPYWASSPSTDFDGPANVLNDGDYHYWNVWSGKAKPFEQYLNITPRFQSEYGLQSFPVMATIKTFTKPGDRHAESPVMRDHQKYDKGNGNKRLLLYIKRNFGVPKNFASFVYLSEVMQADGIQLAAEHLRASRPHSMGSLYWQLNDVWPGASWSSIDYDGRWKALQFHAQRFYAPQIIAALRNKGATTVSLVSDLQKAVPAHWQVQVMDFSGHVKATHGGDLSLPPLASTQVASYSDGQLLQGAAPARTMAVATLTEAGKTIARNVVYFGKARTLDLPLPHITHTLKREGDHYLLTLSSDVLARAVWVAFGDHDATLSDNSITLLPGQTRTLSLTSKASLSALRGALTIDDLAHVMHGAPAAAH